MKPPRITIRRLMAVVALAGVVLGLFVEVPRLCRRWEYCQERATIHFQFEEQNREMVAKEALRMARTEAIFRRLESLGPEPRDLASIIEASGDPEQARWFVKNPGRIGLLYGFDPRTADLDPSENAPISPPVFAQYMRNYYVESWREQLKARRRGAIEQASRKEQFRRAAWRFWEPVPADLPY